ncbi:tautomerase family protein [Chloroflexota bacterium]
MSALLEQDEEIYQKQEGIMPVVTVEMWAGRSIEQKKELVAGITLVMTNLGIPPEAVQIIIKDNPKHNWATGGKLASEESSEA